MERLNSLKEQMDILDEEINALREEAIIVLDNIGISFLILLALILLSI